MQAKVCCVSHTGKFRHNNEDSILVNEKLICAADMDVPECRTWEGERLICLVADGMGGHRKGEVASREVLDAFRRRYEEVDRKERIADVMLLAAEGLDRIVEKDMSSLGLGTTVSGLLIIGEAGIVVNCGDSRVYRQRGRSLEKITKDHSIVQELADAGMITEEEMRTHPQKNIITSAVMGDLSRRLPVFSADDLEIRSGDRFLICTDGVWESIRHDEMSRCLEEKGDAAIRCIYDKVFAAGARDNLTMIGMEIIQAD